MPEISIFWLDKSLGVPSVQRPLCIPYPPNKICVSKFTENHKRINFQIWQNKSVSIEKMVPPKSAVFPNLPPRGGRRGAWQRSSHKTEVADSPKLFFPKNAHFDAFDAMYHCWCCCWWWCCHCCCCHCCCCWCSASGNFNSFQPSLDGNLATESGPQLVFGTISDPANGAGTRPLRKLRNTLLVLFVLREAERLGRQVSKVIPIATRCLKHKTPKWRVFFPRWS